MPKEKKKTANRKQLFVREYVIDLNGTRAAIAAGYSPNGADVTASRLLDNPKVKSILNKVLQDRFSKLEVKSDRILEEVSRLAFANMLDYVTTTKDGDAYVDLSTLTRDQAAAIQELTSEEYMEGRGEEARQIKRTKIKLVDKTKNLELLGRYLKMFAEDKLPPTINVFMLSESERKNASDTAKRLLTPAIDVEAKEVIQ